MLRTSVKLTCPGSRENIVVIVATAAQSQYGIGHPENTGDCNLYIGALDADGKPIDPGKDLELIPGASRHWYYPPSGAVQIVAGCDTRCHGQAVLEYDTPIG